MFPQIIIKRVTEVQYYPWPSQLCSDLSVFFAPFCPVSDCVDTVPKKDLLACQSSQLQRGLWSPRSGLGPSTWNCLWLPCSSSSWDRYADAWGPKKIQRKEIEKKQTIEHNLQTAFTKPSWFYYLALRRNFIFSDKLWRTCIVSILFPQLQRCDTGRPEAGTGHWAGKCCQCDVWPPRRLLWKRQSQVFGSSRMISTSHQSLFFGRIWKKLFILPKGYIPLRCNF